MSYINFMQLPKGTIRAHELVDTFRILAQSSFLISELQTQNFILGYS